MNWRNSNLKKPKYLLCRPQGGLNDALVQIYRGYRYAKTHKRRLIIDSTRSGIYMPFSDFFEFRKADPTVILSLDDALLAQLETMQCRPVELQGRIGSYTTLFSREMNAQREIVSGISTKFDFSLPADEQLVVHENFGGGKKSIEMLGYLRLRESVTQEINRRLRQLPESYVSIHVRNTDMQSDYRQFFKSISSEIAGQNVLLCSDHDQVFEYGSKLFGADRTFKLRRIDGFDGKPLHTLGTGVDDATKASIVLDALTDLMAMAFSQAAYSVPNMAGGSSGFGRLGKMLQMNQSIALQLMRRPVPWKASIYRSVRQFFEPLAWRYGR